jgi:putative membrane protein insertion efficiency factor
MPRTTGPPLPLVGDPSVARWRRLLTVPLRLYKRFISPWLPPACRFEPTCAVYAIEAIERHGLYGVWLGTLRLLRCNPFCKGGYDPVPGAEPTESTDEAAASDSSTQPS